MTIVCRRATPEDLALVERSTAELNSQTAGRLDPTVSLSWPEPDSPLGYRALLADPRWLILVAEDRGAVIGHLAGVIDQPEGRTARVATIFSVHVSADHRGQGAGSALVGAFRAWALERSARVLEVSTYTANSAALRFYQRHGFSPYTSTLQQLLPVPGQPG
jgi:GNAT superfamily N-acetyltransferase